MFKTITLLKRRAGLSRAAFIDYYETHHARIGEKYLRGRATRYVRRYLEAVPDPRTGVAVEPDHDVATEVWYADRAAFEATMAVLVTPEAQAEIVADEEKLFDRARMVFLLVDERESQL